MSTPADLIIPMSPAMRLLLDAMDIARDSLTYDAEGTCSDCTRAAGSQVGGDEKCEMHQADVDKADRIRSLHDAIERTVDAGEIAAILTGTGVAI